MPHLTKRIGIIALFFAITGLIYCGDGDGSNPPPDPLVHTIGGTVSGLTGLPGDLVIRNSVDGEAYDELTLSDDGSFEFDLKVADGAEYEVEPLSFPPGHVCTFTNATGTAEGNVTTVEIECI